MKTVRTRIFDDHPPLAEVQPSDLSSFDFPDPPKALILEKESTPRLYASKFLRVPFLMAALIFFPLSFWAGIRLADTVWDVIHAQSQHIQANDRTLKRMALENQTPSRNNPTLEMP